MAFQRFNKTHARLENRITVTKSRGIGLPTQFFQSEVKDKTHAVLYYDPDQRAIGLRFTSDSSEVGTFTIMRSKKYGGHVSASSFFRVNNVDPSEVSGRYDWEKVPLREAGLEEDGEMYVIKLRQQKTSEEVVDDDVPF